jgi:hypothetical protein
MAALTAVLIAAGTPTAALLAISSYAASSQVGTQLTVLYSCELHLVDAGHDLVQ